MKTFKLLSIRSNICLVLISALFIFSTPASAANKVGVNTGQRQILNCPTNQHAVGMRAVHDDKIIYRIKLRCAGIDSNTGAATSSQTWTAESSSNRSAGASGLRTSNVRCPGGQFLVPSITGHIGTLVRNGRIPAAAISGLVGVCRKFTKPVEKTASNRFVNRSGINHRLITKKTIRVGAEFRGSGSKSINSYNFKKPNRAALSGLGVYSSYALNSFWVIDKAMPWAENRGLLAR